MMGFHPANFGLLRAFRSGIRVKARDRQTYRQTDTARMEVVGIILIIIIIIIIIIILTYFGLVYLFIFVFNPWDLYPQGY